MRHSTDPPDDMPPMEDQLMGLPPKSRLTAGIVCMLAGVVVTLLLWEKGVILYAAPFAFVMGIILCWSGMSGLARQKRRQGLIRNVASNKEDLLRAMIEAKKAGKNPIRLLNEKGIHDADIRTVLIEEMNQRLKS